MSMTITQNLVSRFLASQIVTDKTTLLTVGGAGTTPKGTLLARDSVSDHWVPFAIGGTTNENGIPKAVLLVDIVATGAGNVPCEAIIEGSVYLDKLIVAADGDASNIDAPIIDQLRDYGVIAVRSRDLTVLDNQ